MATTSKTHREIFNADIHVFYFFVIFIPFIIPKNKNEINMFIHLKKHKKKLLT